MAVLAVQQMPVGGFTPSLVAADAAGDHAPAGEGVFVYVVNGSASPVTVDFDIPVAVGSVVGIAPTVAAGGDFWMPIPVRNSSPHVDVGRVIGSNPNPANLANWTYSAATSVQVAVIRAI